MALRPWRPFGRNAREPLTKSASVRCVAKMSCSLDSRSARCSGANRLLQRAAAASVVGSQGQQMSNAVDQEVQHARMPNDAQRCDFTGFELTAPSMASGCRSQLGNALLGPNHLCRRPYCLGGQTDVHAASADPSERSLPTDSAEPRQRISGTRISVMTPRRSSPGLPSR